MFSFSLTLTERRLPVNEPSENATLFSIFQTEVDDCRPIAIAYIFVVEFGDYSQ